MCTLPSSLGCLATKLGLRSIVLTRGCELQLPGPNPATACFCKSSLIGTEPCHLFTYCLWLLLYYDREE